MRLIFFTNQTRIGIILRRLAEEGVDLTEQVVYWVLLLDDIEMRVKQIVNESARVHRSDTRDLHYLVFL